MEHIVAVIIFVGMATAQMSGAGAMSGQVAIPQSTLMPETAPLDSTALPSAPKGMSTILGGEIQNVDPVRDRFTLRVFGQRPVKILFDERTQVYLDGKMIPLRDLHSHDHASVQTVLDGTDVFALSIHILSQSPEGEYQGHVLYYNPETTELTVSSALSHQSLKLLVPMNTRVVREGQSASSAASSAASSGPSDLVQGTLISVKFESDNKGRGVASQITILATPGSAIIFSGNLSSLDMGSGLLVLVDPLDEKSHEIFVDFARLPTSQNLHNGDYVRVTATFDGTRYVADAVDANQGSKAGTIH
jgi:hypothetical protein